MIYQKQHTENLHMQMTWQSFNLHLNGRL